MLHALLPAIAIALIVCVIVKKFPDLMMWVPWWHLNGLICFWMWMLAFFLAMIIFVHLMPEQSVPHRQYPQHALVTPMH